VAVRSRDTLVLRVVARDAMAMRRRSAISRRPQTGSAIALRSTAATARGRRHARAAAYRPGRAADLRFRAPGAGRGGRDAARSARPALGGGVRAAWLGVNHPWVAVRKLQDISGADITLVGRRTLGGGFSLALAAGVGSLSIDTTGGSVSATLLEASARAELGAVAAADDHSSGVARRRRLPAEERRQRRGGHLSHQTCSGSAGPVWMQRLSPNGDRGIAHRAANG